MFSRPFISIWHHLRYVPLLSALTVSRGRSFESRARNLGTLAGLVTRWFPPARWRIEPDLKRVFPEMSRKQRVRLCRDIGRNMGRTLFEIYHCAEFQKFRHKITASGPGLQALQDAQARGKGAIIVSGHFGQWEAIRSALSVHGMQAGAVYRPQKNRHYQRRLLAGIEAGGMPILPTGRAGTKALVSHLRAGGLVAILLDEKASDGERLPFLGHDALTSLAAARLAKKFDVPMVPAYGTRTGAKGDTFAVDFEEPIPATDPETMTRMFNDSLSARIRATPDQWYWLLRRWQDIAPQTPK